MRSTSRSLRAAAAAVVVTTSASTAWAEPTIPFEEKGHLVIDTISGFRLSPTGFTYAGPVGFATRSESADVFNSDLTARDTTNHFWVAPAVDYFVINNLSIGGLVELSSTTGSTTTANQNQNSTTTVDKPSVTNLTFLPRVGYYVPLSARFGVWPRGGIGYTNRWVNRPNDNSATYSMAIVDVDVGFIIRLSDVFFVRLAPELSFGLFGRHSVTNGPTTTSDDAGLLQFAATTGFGANFDL